MDESAQSYLRLVRMPTGTILPSYPGGVKLLPMPGLAMNLQGAHTIPGDNMLCHRSLSRRPGCATGQVMQSRPRLRIATVGADLQAGVSSHREGL